MKKILLSALLTSQIIQASSLKQENSQVEMTIYNQNLAFIHDKRDFSFLQNGKEQVVFEGIPNRIIPESLEVDFHGKAAVISQDYLFDTISLNRLLDVYLGKKVSFKRTKKAPGYETGTLVARNMVKAEDGIVTIDPALIRFENIPEYLSVKPSLMWNLKTAKSTGKADVRYLTRGLSWHSDYTYNLQSEKLSGTITVTNSSGNTFENVSLSCLAGNVHQRRREVYKTKSLRMMDNVAMAAEAVEESAEHGYHVYKIPGKVTIKNKQIKQVSFFSEKVPAEKRNVADLYIANGKFPFNMILEMKAPLTMPAGTLRVYDKRFLGEDRVNNVSKKQKFKIHLGEAFDVKGKIKTVMDKNNGFTISKKEKIAVKNYGETEEKISIKRRYPTGNKLFEIDFSIDSCHAKDAYTYQCDKTLAPGEEFTYFVKYSYHR